MSTSSVSSSNPYGLITVGGTLQSSTGLSSGSTLTNSGAGGTTQITGLSSGINSTELIQAQLAEQELPLNNMQDNIASMQGENSVLGTLQTMLEETSLDSLILSEPSLFFLQQTASSSNSSLVSATTTSNLGAVVGSTTVDVAQLAGASQATYNYTPPTGSQGDTLSIQVGSGAPQTLNVSQGESAVKVADAINSSDTLGAWAAVSNGQLVLSSRTTGTGNEITASTTDTASGTANSDLGLVSSQDGQDAEVYLNGSTTATTSSTDTLTNAIPGVTLKLGGVTPVGSPITVTIGSPAPNTNSILTAVEQFVTDYNSTVEAIEGEVNTAPPSESNSSAAQSDPGSLFGDPQLETLLSQMRQTIYSADGTLPSGYQSLQDLGISTGTSTGSASSSANAGLLTIDTSTLEAAITANPNAVQQALSSWSSGFQTVVSAAASPIGSLSARINGNDTLISGMQSQLSSLTSLYDQEEKNMEAEWAQTESTLADLNTQKTTLSTFSSALSNSSSSG